MRLNAIIDEWKSIFFAPPLKLPDYKQLKSIAMSIAWNNRDFDDRDERTKTDLANLAKLCGCRGYRRGNLVVWKSGFKTLFCISHIDKAKQFGHAIEGLNNFAKSLHTDSYKPILFHSGWGDMRGLIKQLRKEEKAHIEIMSMGYYHLYPDRFHDTFAYKTFLRQIKHFNKA